MQPYLLVLADDHTMFRQGIKKIIETRDDLKIIGEANDGLELLELLKKVKPNLVILDISMPNLRGLEATREIKVRYPEIKILVLTMHKSRAYLHHAILEGVEGYLLKEDADTEFFAAINAIRQGKTYISHLFSCELMSLLATGPYGSGDQSCSDPLTVRERQVVKLIAEGKSNKEIAQLLFVSVRTVEHHRTNAMRKLNLKKTADLVKYAIQEGYIAVTT
ncbi:MAG: response regulator transcription factor [Pseudomonadota bacterium]